MGLSKYIVNFDEFTDELKNKILELINSEFKNKYPKINIDLGSLEGIKELLPTEEYKKLEKEISTFIQPRIKGNQKNVGKLLDIPPLVKENIQTFNFNKDIYITGLHINQTGWKKEDT